jgi:hypothetical protein
VGKTYLFFPDKLGAMKSAEIINDPDDRCSHTCVAKHVLWHTRNDPFADDFSTELPINLHDDD